MYIVYDPISGAIQQTISGPGKDYGREQLDTRNLTWLWLDGAMNVDPTKSYVDIATRSLVRFAPISLSVDKAQFVSDGVDVATVSGIPSGSSVQIYCNGALLHSCIVNDEQKIELTAAAPADYEVRVSCLKFMPAAITLRSVVAGIPMTVSL